MADNVTIPATGSGDATPIVATDKIGGVDYQRVKLTWGTDGTATDASASNPLPIIGASNSGVDIGDVTINNASGGSAVNIQDGGNSITVDGTVAATQSGTWNIATVTTVTTVSAVTAISNALPAGSNAIGKLAANDGVDIGDVTINNASGGSAVNIQDGGNSITVDNGGTFAVQDSQVIADNGAFTDGSSKVFVAGFIFDETAGTALTENDAAAARVDSKRAQVFVQEDGTVRGQRAAVTYQQRTIVQQSSDGVTVSGNVLLAQQRQPVNVSTGGQILISGVTNRRIRVLNGALVASAAANISLKSNNNTDVTGPMPLGANGGYQIPEAEIGNFETNVGESLTIAMSTNVNVGGWLTYILV